MYQLHVVRKQWTSYNVMLLVVNREMQIFAKVVDDNDEFDEKVDIVVFLFDVLEMYDVIEQILNDEIDDEVVLIDFETQIESHDECIREKMVEIDEHEQKFVLQLEVTMHRDDEVVDDDDDEDSEIDEIDEIDEFEHITPVVRTRIQRLEVDEVDDILDYDESDETVEKHENYVQQIVEVIWNQVDEMVVLDIVVEIDEVHDVSDNVHIDEIDEIESFNDEMVVTLHEYFEVVIVENVSVEIDEIESRTSIDW